MRELFINALKAKMKEDRTIWVLLGGVGYGFWELNDRVINCEASEQAMVDMAVGLALSDQKVFVYAITPHLLRAYEGIRIYLGIEKIPVKLVGVGRERDYGALGFTHWGEDVDMMMGMAGIKTTYYPMNEKAVKDLMPNIISSKEPNYISLPR